VFARYVIVALATALPAIATQGQGGIVTGVVRDAQSAALLEAVRVQVTGSTLGGTTDQRGHFVIRGVPVGAQIIRASRIGYRPATKTIRVPVGDSVAANFDLAPSAVELSAVVTTGTGGAVEKQRVGSSMGIVDFTSLRDQVPAGDLASSLSAKVTGLRSISTGGGAGGQSDIRIRGMASFSLDQRPVIYIDGIRVDKQRTEWTTQTGAGGVACCSFAGGNSVDRINDLSPDDIERIEVLKGAAAATLYGSDATNGVIQIFTKHGKSDSAPSWNVSYTGGFDRLRDNLPTKLYPNFVGTDGTRARDSNTLIESGPYSNFDVSVQGGGLRNTYFISTGYMDQEGSIQPNWERRNNLRMNLSFLPSDKWTIEARSMFTRNRIAELQAGNNWTALLGNAMNGNPRLATAARPFGEAWVSVTDIQKIQTFSDANRWTGGVTFSYAQFANLTHRLTVGLDAVNEEKSRFMPWAGDYGPAGVTGGQKNEGYRKYSNITMDYLTQWHAQLQRNIASDFSVGGQGFWEKTDLNLAVGNTFAGPGVNTVAGASVTNGGEGFSEAVNMGGLAQERLSFSDRLFVTLGLRIDGNSAFGNNYGFKRYPKADVAWLLSQYSWVPKFVSSLKLRSAIGQAGKAPGAFDKFTTFSPVSVYTGTPAVVPNNPGNQNIRPETTTESEIGIESGFFSDRLGFEATYYKAITKDGIVNKSNPPSAGFSSASRVNLGAIQNTGWEASINYLAVSMRRFDWTTTIRADGNHNKILDLDGIPQSGSLRVGYPVSGIWDRPPVSFSVVNGKPVTVRGDTTIFFGPPLPTFNLSWSNTLRVGPVSVYANFTMERGAYLNNGDRPYRVRQGGSDEYLKWLNPDGSTTFQADSVLQYMTLINTIDSRDNVRFREFSITYAVPARFTQNRGLGTMTITASGQNLMWWDHCHCVDPNMAYQGGESFAISSGFLAQPAPRQFRLAFRSRY
jgi:TonB-dependent SusC/RagA subfamily outer membrane receptor